MAKTTKETEVEVVPIAMKVLEEKKYGKAAFMNAKEYREDWPFLHVILQDGMKYSKSEVADLLHKEKKEEVKNNG